MIDVKHLTRQELETGLSLIRQSPKNEGTLEMIVIRPDINERKVLHSVSVNSREGVEGDNWKVKKTTSTPDGSPHPDKQVNIMNARAIALIAQTKERWPLAGDQLYVDFDLSEENVPAGTLLAIGTAIFEITEPPHLGCRKFMDRFGKEAFLFVNSETGKALHLRGVNAKVVQDGVIRKGDVVRKIVG